MINTLTILTTFDELEKLKELINSSREKAAKFVGEQVISDFKNAYKDDVMFNMDYHDVVLSSQDFSKDSSDLIYGFERPKEIIEIAKNWNGRLASKVIKSIEKLEALAKENSFSKVSSYIKQNYNSRDFLNISYDLMDALSDLNNIRTYSTELLINSEVDGWNTKMSKYALKEIKSNPEKYVLLEIYYDE